MTFNAKVLALIILLLAVDVIQSQLVYSGVPGVETTGNYMIVLKDNITDSKYKDIKAEVLGKSNISRTINGLFAKIIVANLSEEEAHKISLLEDVEFVEKETFAHGSISWALDRIDQASPVLDGQSNSNGDGQGVNIYSLDTGINYEHCEFGERAKYSGYDPMDQFESTHQNGLDCNGHGTHIASVAVGATLGVATKANIESVRVLGCSNSSPWSVVIDGLNYAAEMILSRKSSSKANIILMPLVGHFSQGVDKISRKIIDHGIPIIAAAGNQGNNACHFSPGGTEGVITVGGSDIGDGIFNSTNSGLCIDVFAPAASVIGGSHSCSTCSCKQVHSGTSIAAGLVAGVAALYLQLEPHLSPAEIKNKLTESCLRDSLNINSLPPNLKSRTSNCLLHINISSHVEITVTKTATFTIVATPTNTPESVCCDALKNINNLKKSVKDSVGNIVAENINQFMSVIQKNISYLIANGGIMNLLPTGGDNNFGSVVANREEYTYKIGDTIESCQSAIQHSSLKSGYYWVKTTNDESYIYCELDKRIKGNRGFARIANINMSVPGTKCPDGFSLREDGRLKTCQRSQEEPGCSSTFFKTNGIQYTKVCGRLRGYQWSTPNAFYSFIKDPHLTIDRTYVDGAILSNKNAYGRQHIWTFAAATDEISRPSFRCPCTNIAVSQGNYNIPSFVGDDYFCETGTRNTYVENELYTSDPLWDGAGCGEVNTCCERGEWFCKDVPRTTSDIELRLCGNEPRSNEDTPLEIIELYVQ